MAYKLASLSEERAEAVKKGSDSEFSSLRRKEGAARNGRKRRMMYDFWLERGWIKHKGTVVYGDSNSMKEGRWKNDKDTRLAAIRFLVNNVLPSNDPRKVSMRDFSGNFLGWVLSAYFGNSPYEAVSKAYTGLNIRPWEMPVTQRGFFSSPLNRKKAVVLLSEALGKNPRDLTRKDFDANGLGGLLHEHYGESPYKAVAEAFEEERIMPWEMITTPRGFFDSPKNRVAAVRWLVEKTTGEPTKLTQEYFVANRLRGLLLNYYKGSPYNAVCESYPLGRIMPWDMQTTPKGTFDSKENRRIAIYWLLERTEKEPHELALSDFSGNGLSSLLSRYKNNLNALLFDNGFVEGIDAHMRELRRAS